MPSLAEHVRARDPDRFLAALFAPAPHRETLFTLIAYNAELARARAAASNPLAALIRLQWWRDAIEEARAGKPPRRHEVAEPLHAAITAGALDADSLIALADAREAETEADGIPSAAAFAGYLRATAGGLAIAAARLLVADPAWLPLIERLGAGYGLAGVLRSVPHLARAGRCLLPVEPLAAVGLNCEAVWAAPDTAAPLIRAMAEEGGARLAEARAEARAMPRALLAATLPAVFASRDLARLARGAATPDARGLLDRAALITAGLRGRL
ncbi:phytoene/squalene synthase family protein [Plastoroseomonas arctica]|uniref:phytoene/squalene synthase family protein n=1 Tax=Plastoroseomonas arctica TaxID=1509237 RepID=UPI001FEA44BE|nr:squalene/phytoene synthase family protein [Plastoroseomonas arctica]